MYKGYQIVACTPAGRREYLEVLSKYIIANKGIIDKWHIWLNTTNLDDIQYMTDLHNQYPHFISIKRCGDPGRYAQFISRNIHTFFRYTTDANTIYIRFDDDIVFIDSECVANLAQCKLDHPDRFIVSANVINNAICTHILQRIMAVPTTFGVVSWHALDGFGWSNPQFAYKLHDHFLNNIDNIESFKFPDYDIYDYAQISINCIAWMGKDSARFFEAIHEDEESYITIERPRQLGIGTVICGKAIVSHFAFFTQRGFLATTDLLDRYKDLFNGRQPTRQRPRKACLLL